LPVIGWTVSANSPQKGSEVPHYPYYPAFCSTNRIMGQAGLVVFPFDKPSVTIPLPCDLHGHAYSPDGRALYTGGEGGVCKIEFNPTRVSLLPGSEGLGVGNIAVSADQSKILISGAYRQSDKVHTGLFDLSLLKGKVTQILSQEDMSAKSQWAYLSLSHDGQWATALHNYRLELIDLTNGKTKPVGEGMELGAWSPDGKWLAVSESGGQQRTILLDAETFARRRILGSSDLEWSPDSRYLIGWKRHDLCGWFRGTLQAIDINSGKRLTIKSSRCKVDQATTGWVSRDIVG
jgi:WD40 repeat protein